MSLLVCATTAIIILSTECILAFRTYAIWQKQKWVSHSFPILPFCIYVGLDD